MPRRLVIAHLSDLHLSRFGERVTPSTLLGGRLPRPGLLTRVEWTDLESVDGWRIQRWTRASRRVAAGGSLGLRLMDPSGVRHDRALVPPGRSQPRRVDDAVAGMRALARVRSRAALASLCAGRVGREERTELLRLDPHNTNLRFVEALDEVRKLSPDLVVVTGDVTDDGHGYELVTCSLSEHIVSDRFFVVAGNHDLSAVPPGTRQNMPLEDKQLRWAAFRSAARLEPEQDGVSVLEHEGVLLLGLNSSVRPSKLAFSGRGQVGKRQLEVAARLVAGREGSRVAICCLHHHVAHLSLGPISRTDPGQFAMKLRDARQVVDLLVANGFEAVLNGHRHHGYHVREGHLPHVVSSPSTTLGCRASGTRYFWLVTVEDRRLRVERHYIGGEPSRRRGP